MICPSKFYRSHPGLAALAAILLAAGPLRGQSTPDEAGYIIRLGTDTVAVESFTLTPDRLHAVAVTRSPSTRIREITLRFGPDGGVQSFEDVVRDPSAPASARPVQRTVIIYGPDSATVETERADQVETSKLPAGPDVIPSSIVHFSLAELVIRRALASGRDTIYRLAEEPEPQRVRRLGPDSVALETGGLGTWRARVDAAGRVLGMEAGALGRRIVRVRDLDVDAVARRWAEEDDRGVGMGPLSPRDTLVADVHGARISVDYSRPSKRGRVVFGGLVPWNEVWRTGANVATQFSTDRALILNGTRVSAGSYTLFTIPRPDGWTLIINRETGQPGTDHDPSQDLARLTLKVETLNEPVERFTIAVEERSGDSGVLAFLWDRTRAAIPFQVAR